MCKMAFCKIGTNRSPPATVITDALAGMVYPRSPCDAQRVTATHGASAALACRSGRVGAIGDASSKVASSAENLDCMHEGAKKSTIDTAHLAKQQSK